MSQTNLISFPKARLLEEERDGLYLIPFKNQKETLKSAFTIHENLGFKAFLLFEEVAGEEKISLEDLLQLQLTTLYLPYWKEAKTEQKEQIKNFKASLKGRFAPKIIIGVDKNQLWNIF